MRECRYCVAAAVERWWLLGGWGQGAAELPCVFCLPYARELCPSISVGPTPLAAAAVRNPCRQLPPLAIPPQYKGIFEADEVTPGAYLPHIWFNDFWMLRDYMVRRLLRLLRLLGVGIQICSVHVGTLLRSWGTLATGVGQSPS